MIRQATISDCPTIAQLIYIVWQDMELDMVKEIPKAQVIDAIIKSCTEVTYRTYYQHIWVYEVGGEIAGCIIAYNANKELTYEQNWTTLDLPLHIKKFGSPLPVKEAKDNEYYIETVAVFDRFRRQGIATKLITYLLQQQPTLLWSLNCDKYNEQAFKLYQKVGFTYEDDITLYGHDYYHMVY
ncbi:GNAT family N-acetyltransferase [Staphylococcus simiae]|uniref:N-acetyltransferase domain-containing protein n=1 Tax=Staphylococcus simiae CCM 7213 = CCUG 51256 TaxID=911238 RepID=G5JHB2_9STAP|nr:GNAT family N-acetyltransferase [Staphylococcus simiae]EHJ08460.1 hypothetical protein SS7213T_04205 [Staphylococcus simiae CCM 7213 = CCUG 51256]PNZ12560.1 N-acetyltransferase [Staphylococcus simiae]SNV67630.1 Acetyltransferase (GNAT family) [Staphylococcus simiae]